MSGDPMWLNQLGGWQHWPHSQNVACGGGIPQYQTFTAIAKYPPDPPSLSDADVERIARRVAELLREAKP